MDIWTFQRRLTTMLLGWAAASITYGLRLLRHDSQFRQGLGEQFAGWGAVNALIALFGWTSAARRQQLPGAVDPATQAAERHKIARLLWVNTALDVFYVAGGALAARTRGAADERWRGRGIGIMIQGGFLFFFDLINAVRAGQIRISDES
jgi:hypothetical protein